MTPYEQIKVKYEAAPHDRPWGWWLEWHAVHGFIFSTPDYFVMGRPIQTSFDFHDLALAAREQANAWYIFAFSGDLSQVWSILPFPLGWIAFERIRDGKRELTTVKSESLRRLCVSTLTHVPEEPALA